MKANMKIGRYDIKLQEMTWWQSEEIKASLASGAKMNASGLNGFDGAVLLEAKLKTLEACIKEIKEGEKELPYSKSWVQGLTSEEGEALDKAIDELTKKK